MFQIQLPNISQTITYLTTAQAPTQIKFGSKKPLTISTQIHKKFYNQNPQWGKEKPTF